MRSRGQQAQASLFPDPANRPRAGHQFRYVHHGFPFVLDESGGILEVIAGGAVRMPSIVAKHLGHFDNLFAILGPFRVKKHNRTAWM